MFPDSFFNVMQLIIMALDTYKKPKLEEVIGEGTFGTVYRAVWRGTVVAAKVINIPAGSESTVQKEIAMCKYVYYNQAGNINQCS